MFASQVKSTVDVDGVSVTIRKLSARSLEAAAEARTAANLAQVKAMGGDILKALRDAEDPRSSASPDLETRRLARYRVYDRAAVLRAGIAGWSAPEKVETAVDDLDEAAAELLHRAILDLSLPPIDPHEQQAAEGKDSGASISS